MPHAWAQHPRGGEGRSESIGGRAFTVTCECRNNASSCSSALRLELRHLHLDAGQLSRTASSVVLQNTIVASSFVRSLQRC